MPLINIRIDDNLKKDAEEILEDMGLNMTTAITIHLKAIVRTKSIPFNLGLSKNDNKVEQNEKPILLQTTDNEILEIKDWLLEQEFISISSIVRNFGVGFPKAGRIFNKLIDLGLIEATPTKSNKYKVIKN